MNTISVLLVDDNATFLRHAARFLDREQHLHVVGTAQLGREGVKKAEVLQPNVILLDASMPDQSGLDTIPLLKEVAPASRIIMLTTLEAAALKDLAFDLGADGFVTKSEMTKAIVPEITRVVG